MKSARFYKEISQSTLAFWYAPTKLAWVLAPLSWVFQLICFMRYQFYLWHKKEPLPVPIIVVGNITIGGTGKTPFVCRLVKYLKQQGRNPGIILRGYGGTPGVAVMSVQKESKAFEVGDEALLLAHKCDCPIVIGKKRYEAAQFLFKNHTVDIIISDDGLQHYALPRNIEIVIIDGEKRFGNGFCLPVGPLRESVQRLNRVDFVVTNGQALEKEWPMQTTLDEKCVYLDDEKRERPLADFVGETVHAIAGVGNPQRFFNMLKAKGINVIEHPFPDHYSFQETDLIFSENYPVLMTEKDAVKCKSIKGRGAWVVSLSVDLPPPLFEEMMRRLQHGSKTA